LHLSGLEDFALVRSTFLFDPLSVHVLSLSLYEGGSSFSQRAWGAGVFFPCGDCLYGRRSFMFFLVLGSRTDGWTSPILLLWTLSASSMKNHFSARQLRVRPNFAYAESVVSSPHFFLSRVFFPCINAIFPFAFPDSSPHWTFPSTHIGSVVDPPWSCRVRRIRVVSLRP